jgi:aminoglycoside phosphotransferase (APT) family kinase protein
VSEIPRGVDALVARVLGDVDGIERAVEGVSTEVCRIDRGEEVFFLRLAREGSDMSPEVEAHERLRALGVRVADVIHYEPLAEETGGSVAITTAVPGTSLIGCGEEQTSRQVARAAGRDLALLNSVETDGFGWALRDGLPGLRGPYGSWSSWVREAVAPDARPLLAAAIGAEDVAAIERLIAEEVDRPNVSPRLAHGDFDVSQIFHSDGAYTGIIDLGDLQGAHWNHDLAHFLLHDTEQNEYALLPDVIAGYVDVAGVDVDENALIRNGVLQAVFNQSRVLVHFGEGAIDHPYMRMIFDRIKGLIERL